MRVVYGNVMTMTMDAGDDAILQLKEAQMRRSIVCGVVKGRDVTEWKLVIILVCPLFLA
jgi:methanogenic corrinoid protein MtbC1